MIDWFRGSIPFIHTPINGGEVFSVQACGSVDWRIVKSLKSRGSHESSINLKSSGSDGQGNATELWIDGNISKYLQGHNLFGSRDLIDLVYQTFTRITKETPELYFIFNDAVSAEQSILNGDFQVKAIDINQIYRLENDRSVESWLYACEMQANKRAGRSTSSRGTVYLGQHSRRWGIKFYNKFREMLKHQSDTHPHYERLLGFANGVLRIELRLLSQELKDNNLTDAKTLTEDKINDLFNDYISRIEMKTNAVLIDKNLMKLPRTCQATYQLWRSGVCCRDMLSKATFFRHRKQLLEHSIDINFPPSSSDRNNVVPLLRIVEAKPIEIPQWAHYLELIA